MKGIISISTEFLGKKTKSPLVLPAGIMGMTWSGMKFVIENGCGIITSKSLTLELRTGHPGPVVAEFEGGMLNCMGLCNPGIIDGLQEINEFKAIMPEVPVIASVFATKTEDFEELTRHVNDSQADFIELNLSCPNVMDEFGMPLAGSIDMVKEITSRVKAISKLPVITKLSPNVTGLTNIALAAEEAGADALCMINTLGPGMLVDIDMVKPVLSNRTGGLSGACVKPIALRAVYEAYSRVKIPIIGTGGVESGSDAVEMLMSGAALVGVGSAVYQGGIGVFKEINQGIRDYMKKYKYENINEIPRLEKLNEQA
ncbi:MAG: dihydroorotate dehydrogenase [Candidatus Stygibacter australis]|nr:dihydroorotate dehydrogenase [Candidatus Stygibacter australis]MDP8321917.1 dihydroorotate dehydrogenase [Candidatus Stygibacter australis]